MADKSALDKAALKQPDPNNERPHPVMAVLAGFMLAIVMLICCVCGGGAWWFRPQLMEDEKLADQVAHEIVDMTIPPSFQPKGTIQWNVAFTMRVQGAYYELYAGDGVLTIIEVQSRFRAEHDVRQHIRQTLLEKGGGGEELFIDNSLTVQREFTIRGQKVPFLFQIGEDRTRRNHRYHIVEGVFDGKGGEVLISLRIDEDSWNDAEVELMLKSLESAAVPEDGNASPSPTQPTETPVAQPGAGE